MSDVVARLQEDPDLVTAAHVDEYEEERDDENARAWLTRKEIRDAMKAGW